MDYQHSTTDHTTNTTDQSATDKANELIAKAKPHLANAVDYAKKNPDTVLLGVIAFLLTDLT